MRKLPEASEVFRRSYSPYGYAGEHDDWLTVAFNGNSRDRLGLDHLGIGRRVYSCSLMRFLSADNLSPFSDGGINAYAYCIGDPVNYSDPSGAMRRFMVQSRVPRSVGQKKVTWSEDVVNKPTQVFPGPQHRTPSVQVSKKPILKTRSTVTVDTKPPAAPMDYDGAIMTDSELDHLEARLKVSRQLRSTHKWGSEGYREADTEVKRLNRIAKVQLGIRQDNGLQELTRERFRYRLPGTHDRYPEEPPVDYD